MTCAALGLSACTNALVRTLKPERDSGVWKNGIFLQDSIQPHSQVRAGFAAYAKDGYSFETSIENLGPSPVDINPAGIRCRELDASGWN